MKELVEYIVKSLVNNPESVQITQTEGDSVTIVEIKVGQEDVGKVIGKEGRIVNAIRTIVKSAGAKQNKRATVEIITESKGEIK